MLLTQSIKNQMSKITTEEIREAFIDSNVVSLQNWLEDFLSSGPALDEMRLDRVYEDRLIAAISGSSQKVADKVRNHLLGILELLASGKRRWTAANLDCLIFTLLRTGACIQHRERFFKNVSAFKIFIQTHEPMLCHHILEALTNTQPPLVLESFWLNLWLEPEKHLSAENAKTISFTQIYEGMGKCDPVLILARLDSAVGLCKRLDIAEPNTHRFLPGIVWGRYCLNHERRDNLIIESKKLDYTVFVLDSIKEDYGHIVDEEFLAAWEEG